MREPSMLSILVSAGVLDPKYASAEWQAYCKKHFQPERDASMVDFTLMVRTPTLRAQRRRPH